MRIAQICNIGNVCGGTAACAWSITHALADHDHIVCFLSSPTSETRKVFKHCQILNVSQVELGLLEKISPDLLMMHNTTPSKIQGQDLYPSIQYHHSVGKRARANIHVTCSKWLMEQSSEMSQLLYQPIPVPGVPKETSRTLSDEFIIGRICTPTHRKWPQDLIPFYEELVKNFPKVIWEFVGVPDAMKPLLKIACRDRCRFFAAGVDAREHYWRWDALLYHHPDLTESFGRTVAEAMRAGCIPVADARGGFCEQIDDSQSGFLCDSSAEFIQAVQQLMDRKLRRKMSKQAIDTASRRFSLETFYRRFRKILQTESTLFVQ